MAAYPLSHLPLLHHAMGHDPHGGFEGTVKALRKDFKFLGESGCYFFLWVVKEPVPPYEEWSAERAQTPPRSTARAKPDTDAATPRARRR